MPRPRTKPAFDADDLLEKYNLYDQAVDVVSCYQWLFQNVKELAATVQHFERYPRIPVGQKTLTPDFTVSFVDGDALVGEVARIARQDKSVDGLCRQLHGYSQLTSVPDRPTRQGTQFTPAKTVDVLFVTHMRLAKEAAQHVLKERLDNPTHPFKPPRRPVLVEFSQDQDEYVFVLYPEGNGTLARGQRAAVYGDKEPYVCRPGQFDRLKIQYGFMNDNVAPLYMATRLWLRVFPNAFWDDDHKEVAITLQKLVAVVRDQHEGKGTSADVRQGMEVLVAAQLAKEVQPGTEWTVKRQSLRRTDKDVAHAIVERIVKRTAAAADRQKPARVAPATVRTSRRGSPAPSGQDALF